MLQSTHNGLTLFRFHNLSRETEIRHAVFARRGGVSPPPFASLNFGESTGDSPDCVRRNRRLAAACFDGMPLVFSKQVHGDRVLVIESKMEADSPKRMEGDAMVTALNGVALCIKVADCQAVMLYDPKKRVIANVHSGWRGSVANIIAKTIQTMTERFGCSPSDILAAISPSLGPCCAEFKNYEKELPEPFWEYKDDLNRFDFWRISNMQLIEAGVPGGNIETAGLCTSCNTDLFFSYRKEGTTGRFAAAIAMLGP